jgi:hypothetical protein
MDVGIYKPKDMYYGLDSVKIKKVVYFLRDQHDWTNRKFKTYEDCLEFKTHFSSDVWDEFVKYLEKYQNITIIEKIKEEDIEWL